MGAKGATELVTVSVKLPKKLDDDLEEFMKEKGYATKAELFRELLRGQLYQTVEDMRGALKGKVPPLEGTMGDWRREEWRKYLKKANGDHRKAVELLEEDERKTLEKLGL